jgi:hypothetical protein
LPDGPGFAPAVVGSGCRVGLLNLGELVENEGGIDRGVALARDRIEGVATPIIVKRPLELTLLPRGLPKPLVDCTGKAEGLLVTVFSRSSPSASTSRALLSASSTGRSASL